MTMLELDPRLAGAPYTPRELAERVGISVSTIQILINKNELEAVNIGKGHTRPRWLIPEEEAVRFIDSYVDGRTVKAEDRKPAKKVEEVTQVEDKKKSEKDILLKKLFYVKEAMLDLSIRMEEIERELEKF